MGFPIGLLVSQRPGTGVGSERGGGSWDAQSKAAREPRHIGLAQNSSSSGTATYLDLTQLQAPVGPSEN